MYLCVCVCGILTMLYVHCAWLKAEWLFRTHLLCTVAKSHTHNHYTLVHLYMYILCVWYSTYVHCTRLNGFSICTSPSAHTHVCTYPQLEQERIAVSLKHHTETEREMLERRQREYEEREARRREREHVQVEQVQEREQK